MSQSQHAKPRYRTINWKQYNAAVKARGSLIIWLDKGMSWFSVGAVVGSKQLWNLGEGGRIPTVLVPREQDAGFSFDPH